jgi:hypothetical protein
MTDRLPWDEIGIPTRDYIVRKIATASAIPLFWGRDTSGRCLAIIELEGDFAEAFRRGVVELHGINVDLRDSDAQQQRLVLTLDRNVDQDLFLGLCQTLINALEPMTTSFQALTVTLAHIRRWRAFLAARKSRRLSDEEVRGLWTELHYMRALYACRLTPPVTVDAWTGADMRQQDFIFDNTAIEVKSLHGRDRNTVRISSEDQLSTVVDDLFLVTHRLAVTDDDTGALSLNALVELIESELGDGEALEQFSQKLADFGYLPITAYDTPEFVVAERQAYRVKGDFPRLVRAELPSGITRVSYEIELEAMKNFEADDNEVLKGG